jgi:hypothetical protein
VSFGAFYEFLRFSTSVPIAQGAGITVAFSSGGASRYGVTLMGDVLMPVTADDGVLGVRVLQGGGHLMGSLELRLATALSARLGLGPGLHFARVEPISLGPSARADDARIAVSASGRGTLGLAAQVMPHVALGASFLCEVDPSGTHYFVVQNGRQEELLAPWAVRPGLTASLEALF